jgi:hypothetical protein
MEFAKQSSIRDGVFFFTRIHLLFVEVKIELRYNEVKSTGDKMSFNKRTGAKYVLVAGFLSLLFLSWLMFTPFSGISWFAKTNYHIAHHERLFLDEIHYRLVTYRSINVFSSFAVIELKSPNDTQALQALFLSDPSILRYDVVSPNTSSRPLSHFNYAYQIEDLPFDFDCGCFTAYTFNERMERGGYQYLVLRTKRPCGRFG